MIMIRKGSSIAGPGWTREFETIRLVGCGVEILRVCDCSCCVWVGSWVHGLGIDVFGFIWVGFHGIQLALKSRKLSY